MSGGARGGPGRRAEEAGEGLRLPALLLLVLLFWGVLTACLSLTLLGLGRGGEAALTAVTGLGVTLASGLALDRVGRGG